MCVDALFCEIPVGVIICHGRVGFDDGWDLRFVINPFEHA